MDSSFSNELNGGEGPITCSNVKELVSKFPDDFLNQRPKWCSVRWVDIEGLNGEIIQFFLRLHECERRYVFNDIVDIKQRSMGILLQSPGTNTNKAVINDKSLNFNIVNDIKNNIDSNVLKNIQSAENMNKLVRFLMVTKVVSIRPDQKKLMYPLDGDNTSSPRIQVISDGKYGFQLVQFCW